MERYRCTRSTSQQVVLRVLRHVCSGGRVSTGSLGCCSLLQPPPTTLSRLPSHSLSLSLSLFLSLFAFPLSLCARPPFLSLFLPLSLFVLCVFHPVFESLSIFLSHFRARRFPLPPNHRTRAFLSIALPPSFFHGVHHRRDAIGPTLFVPFLALPSFSLSPFSSLLFPCNPLLFPPFPSLSLSLSLSLVLSFATSMPLSSFSTPSVLLRFARRARSPSRVSAVLRPPLSFCFSRLPACLGCPRRTVFGAAPRSSSHQPHRPRRARAASSNPTPQTPWVLEFLDQSTRADAARVQHGPPLRRWMESQR